MTTLSPPLADTILLYYQVANGSLIEASFPPFDFNNTLSNVTNYNWTVVADKVDLRSPLAATSWIDPISNVYIVSADGINDTLPELRTDQ